MYDNNKLKQELKKLQIDNNKLKIDNKKQVRKAIIEWTSTVYNDRLKDFRAHKQLDPKSDQNLAFALSITYNLGHTKSNSFAIINSKFEHIFKKIMVLTRQKNITRYKKLWPLAIMFCDVAGTKYGLTGTRDENDNAHHHGIFYIHPYQLEKWNTEEKISKIISELEKFNDVQSVIIKPLLTENDRKHWVDYSSKYLCHNINYIDISDDPMLILP